jgi:hypothetical protein
MPMTDMVKKAYNKQKNSSKFRGINFKFTFEEWCSWWEHHLGPDWFKKRGCRRGQYVMARNWDRGPYAFWNVKCVLCSDNNFERASNETSTFGERHGNAELTEADVIYIRSCGKTIKELTNEFNVAKQSLTQARNGLRWKHLNKLYPPVKGRGKFPPPPMKH